ncbi:MAG: tyrosine-type recombinase/integrase [Bacteroides sp.]|nr:tyrosine-type recombinase/integrase [Bacteroides sp.]
MEEFEKYMRYELNRSPHTVEAYCRDIRQFMEWISASGPASVFDPGSVTTGDIRAWLTSIAHHESPLTLRRKTQSLRAYFRFLLKRGAIKSNPAADVTLAKAPKHLPEFVKESEIEEIVENYNPDDFHSVRNHIVMLLLYSTGIRREELRTITDADIDFSLKEVKVLGKRSKQRNIPLPPELLEEIRHWQSVRDNRYPDLPTPRPLIAGPSGALSRSAIYGIVREALASSSAMRKSPHVLRHTFATAMLNNGASLDSVKEFLGHSSLSTTQIYTHLSFAELKKAYNSAHPRSHPDSGKE